ncbi:MAG: flagellar basal-body rod protein FlgF [Terriglobales bacterium]
MGSGYYAALSGLLARTQALDVVANNIANADTTAFKAHAEYYQALNAGDNTNVVPGLGPLNQAINAYGVLGGQSLDLAQGQIQSTGNPLDLALEGPGYFVAQTAAGARYTRDGSFHLSPAGVLLTAAGDPVLNPKGQPLRLAPGPVTISPDGVISSRGAIAGQIAVVKFPAGTPLTAQGDSYFRAPAAAAQAAPSTQLKQGSLEHSNLSPVQGMVSLIELQQTSELLQKALTSFNDQFDQPATTELPQVQE